MENTIHYKITTDGKKRYTEKFKQSVRRDRATSGLSNKELAVKYNTTQFNVWSWCKGRKSRAKNTKPKSLLAPCMCSREGYKSVKMNWLLRFLGY